MATLLSGPITRSKTNQPVTDSLAPIDSDAVDIPASPRTDTSASPTDSSVASHSDDSDSENTIVVSPSAGLATGSTLERLMEIMVQQQIQDRKDRHEERNSKKSSKRKPEKRGKKILSSNRNSKRISSPYYGNN